MKNLRNATLLFLVKKSKTSKIIDICLAMKKRGFGVNRWNGVGGKVELTDKSIEQAAKREAREEIGVKINELEKVAELSFYFVHNHDWDQKVHVYVSEKWSGNPKESEEMNPQWFLPDNLSYKNMWPDDPYWLPNVLKGRFVKATFKFAEGDIIKYKKVQVVDRI